VRNLRRGDRVVVGSTVGCGACSYCRAGCYSQCDKANPAGKTAGTAFFGGPDAAGGLDGMQAEYVRGAVRGRGRRPAARQRHRRPAIMLSDLFPAARGSVPRLAQVSPVDTVAVSGAGPVGQFAVLSAFRQGAARVLVVDGITSRLDSARQPVLPDVRDVRDHLPVDVHPGSPAGRCAGPHRAPGRCSCCPGR